MIEKHAAQTLNQCAHGLAVHDCRIDGAPDVLHRYIIEHLDMAGSVVDRDVSGMGTVTVGTLGIGKGPLDRDCTASPGGYLAERE